jgi:predicted component of type VI protein secretion system
MGDNMFGFKKKESERDRVRREFDHFSSTMRRAPEIAQILVGHTLNQAEQIFLARYKTIQNFSDQSAVEQSLYMQQLLAMEENLQKIEPPASLAYMLFRYYIASLIERDDTVTSHFVSTIRYFREKAPMPAF